MKILKPFYFILSVSILLPQQQSINGTEELDIAKIRQKAKADAKADVFTKSKKIKVKGIQLPTHRVMELTLQNEQYRSVYLPVYLLELKNRPFKWKQMVGNEQSVTLSFRLKKQWIFNREGWEQFLSIGYLTSFATTTDFALLYSILEWHKPLVEENLLKVSLFGGGGVGYYTMYGNYPPHSDGYRDILTAGLQFQLWRLVGDGRIYYGSAIPKIHTRLSVGYQGKTWQGSLVGPSVVIIIGYLALSFIPFNSISMY